MGIKVQAMEAGVEPAPLPAELPEPFPGALIHMLGLRSGVVRRCRIDTERPAELEIYFTGEYSRSAKGFSDVAWLTDMKDWTRVWEPDIENTSPAGGTRRTAPFTETSGSFPDLTC